MMIPGLQALVLAVLMQAASTPSWPAGAGAPPQASPSAFMDPSPRYFDPPAGSYVQPDGSIVHADPPPGYYDLPPGHYPLVLTGPDELQGPLPSAEASMPAWSAKRRRLRIGLGVSLGVVGVGVLAPLVGLVLLNARTGDRPCIDCYPPGTIFALVVIPAGIIATLVTGIRLGVHARRRPVLSRFDVTAGGLRLSF
jgi:hypothetical protein